MIHQPKNTEEEYKTERFHWLFKKLFTVNVSIVFKEAYRKLTFGGVSVRRLVIIEMSVIEIV